MNPRIRRLNADYEKVQAVFRAHPFIRLMQVEGTPPEKYTFVLPYDYAGVPSEHRPAKDLHRRSLERGAIAGATDRAHRRNAGLSELQFKKPAQREGGGMGGEKPLAVATRESGPLGRFVRCA